MKSFINPVMKDSRCSCHLSRSFLCPPSCLRMAKKMVVWVVACVVVIVSWMHSCRALSVVLCAVLVVACLVFN